MEKNYTAQIISSNVNRALINHFIFGWDVTDKMMEYYFSEYEDDEWNYFTSLWNERVLRITEGLKGLN